MFNRPMLFLGVLAASFIVPYVLLDENLSKTAKSQLSRLTGPSKPAAEGGFKIPWLASGETASPAPVSTAKFIAAPPVSLEEALRFDITPPWVAARWPTVSTVAGDAKYMGLRVAYVSGTQPSDVAGSLTYYFNDRHELEKLTLEGLTGDETRLVQFVSHYYGLRPTPTLIAGLYVKGDPNKPSSKLRVLHLPTMRADQPLARAQVALELSRGDASQPPATSAAPPPTPATWQSPELPADFRRW
ncbi:MAG: DUF6690 family protein [Pirellulaceae bacterium]|nr:DUF6690 family protein [Pirellulaceae bacterium]